MLGVTGRADRRPLRRGQLREQRLRRGLPERRRHHRPGAGVRVPRGPPRRVVGGHRLPVTLQLAYQDVATDGHRPAVLVLHREDPTSIEDVGAPPERSRRPACGGPLRGLLGHTERHGGRGPVLVPPAARVRRRRPHLARQGGRAGRATSSTAWADRAPHALVGFRPGRGGRRRVRSSGARPDRSPASTCIPGIWVPSPRAGARRAPRPGLRPPARPDHRRIRGPACWWGPPRGRRPDPSPGAWLGGHGADVTTWVWDGSGEHEAALAERLGLWLDTQAPRRSTAPGRSRIGADRPGGRGTT